MGTLVFKPEQIYHRVQNVAPDLIVHFGALYWRSIGGVGYPTIHVLENDTGPDDCNHAQFGAFVLAGAEEPTARRGGRRRLLDIAPTLMDLAGYQIPGVMQGRSLAAGVDPASPGEARLRTRRRDHHPRPAQRAGLYRLTLVIGHWSLVIGHWSLVIGHWSLVIGGPVSPGVCVPGLLHPGLAEAGYRSRRGAKLALVESDFQAVP